MTLQEKVDAVLSGKIRIRRFSAPEQSGSSDAADRFLWTAILLAESELAASDGGGLCTGSAETPGGVASPFLFLNKISTPLPPNFDALVADLGLYADRGQESIVFDAGDGFVNKVRLMRPSALSGYLAPLANVVYHNRLFPRDRYTLEAVYERNGAYFMLLRQPLVHILLDEKGYPVCPSASQIRMAIDDLPAGLIEYEESDEADPDSSDSGTSDDLSPTRLRFYNSDYWVSDLQPGRNVVIDALSGEIRFIDPRIILNDSQGPITRVSRYGNRSEALRGQVI